MRISRNLPALSPQPAAPSAEVLALRSSWKWAYLSHFLFTYNPVLHLEDIQLSELEDDLADGTFEVIPTVMQRLLMSLTPHDKRMILENWQQQLRKQSLKRAPDHNLMGTEDDPVNFFTLTMSDKLHLFQILCEWQFHNPNNLRARMRDDDEYANWRMEPIAYDAKGNAYWLMGGNRLWMHYEPPCKRVANSHKRKRPATSVTNGRKSVKREQAAASSKTTSATTSDLKVATSNPTRNKSVRDTRSRAPLAGSSNQQKSRTMGTRVSSRLRGREEEEVWQPIPEEWLKEEPKDCITGSQEDDQQLSGKENGLEVEAEVAMKSLDDVSELTSLSDLSELPEAESEDASEDEESTPTPPPNILPPNEEVWETVCVTLAEWEAFPQRFEKSTNRAEKAFYKLLKNDLVPMITDVLRVDVRKKVMEEAVVHRKRSSRIAVKESVREAERAEARRKAEEEKEMERHKRWEARARKDEEDRIRRENMRSARLRETGRTRSESLDVDVVDGVAQSQPFRLNGTVPDISAPVGTQAKFVVNAYKSGTQTPKDDESWELDCEICHRKGINLDDGQELMCCEKCGKWQHIRCHDQADFIRGRPRRNWELDDFLCAACTAKNNNEPDGPSSSASSQQYQRNHSGHAHVPGQYNGATATASHDSILSRPGHSSQPEYRTAPLTQSASSQQIIAPHGNGQTNSLLPQGHAQPSYSTLAGPPVPYTQRPQTAATQSRVTAPIPYTSSPNMYLSNYSGNNPPPQNHATQLHQPASSHYRSTVPLTQPGTWSQQRSHPSQLANHAWNGSIHDSGPHAYTGHGTGLPHQQNSYYRAHPTTMSHPPPSNHLPPAQPYYSNGPSSQS